MSVSAGETLSLAVLLAGFSSGKDQSSAGTWSFVLFGGQDRLVESTDDSWALGLESFHSFADISVMGSNWNSLAGCFWGNNLVHSDFLSLSLSDHSSTGSGPSRFLHGLSQLRSESLGG